MFTIVKGMIFSTLKCFDLNGDPPGRVPPLSMGDVYTDQRRVHLATFRGQCRIRGGGRFGPVEGGGAPASNERDQNCYVDRDRFSVIKLIIIVSGAFGPPRAMINDPLGAVRGGGGPHR